jgi:hypothetical protein
MLVERAQSEICRLREHIVRFKKNIFREGFIELFITLQYNIEDAAVRCVSRAHLVWTPVQ